MTNFKYPFAFFDIQDQQIQSILNGEFDDSRSMAKPGQRLQITQLSKNILFLVFEYLGSNRIIGLALSCKNMYNRFMNDDYFKSQLIEKYFLFYFQQFPRNTIQIEEYFQQFYSNLSKKLSLTDQNSSELYSNLIVGQPQEGQMVNIFQNDKETFQSQDIIFIQLHDNYKYLNALKYFFINNYSNDYYNYFKSDIQYYLRDMYLDPTECRSSAYLLPPLGRDTFQKKGYFNRTEKIIMNIYLKEFQCSNLQKAKQVLIEKEFKLGSIFNNEKVVGFFNNLYSRNPLTSKRLDFFTEIFNYTLIQFRILVEAHNLELQNLKRKIYKNQGHYEYIYAFTQQNKNFKQLLKKIIKNEDVRFAFRKMLVINNFIQEDEYLKFNENLLDILLVNILEQIWIQNVHEKNIQDLVTSLEYEIDKCHDFKDKLRKFQKEKKTLLKASKFILSSYHNQINKQIYARYINQDYNFNENYYYHSQNRIQSKIIKSITKLLKQAYYKANSLQEFLQYIEKYEQINFLFADIKSIYYQLKSKFINQVIVKWFIQKIDEYSHLDNVLNEINNCTLFQIIPQEFQNTIIFSWLKSILNKNQVNIKEIKATIFTIFRIEKNTEWAQIYNDQMIQIYEQLHMQQMDQNKQYFKYQFKNFEGEHEDDKMEDENDTSEQYFLDMLNEQIKQYNFQQQIQIKQEEEKQKIIDQIKQNIKHLKQSNPNLQQNDFLMQIDNI